MRSVSQRLASVAACGGLLFADAACSGQVKDKAATVQVCGATLGAPANHVISNVGWYTDLTTEPQKIISAGIGADFSFRVSDSCAAGAPLPDAKGSVYQVTGVAPTKSGYAAIAIWVSPDLMSNPHARTTITIPVRTSDGMRSFVMESKPT